jgi:putative CocE/NonD family hydrolase
MVAMRDGVKLATDIYRPAGEGRYPVILERTPYNKDSLAAAARYLVPHGYILVAQDVRRRYRSEGHWVPIRDDPNDGFDTANWIAAQTWCDVVRRGDAACAGDCRGSQREGDGAAKRHVGLWTLRSAAQRRL